MQYFRCIYAKHDNVWGEKKWMEVKIMHCKQNMQLLDSLALLSLTCLSVLKYLKWFSKFYIVQLLCIVHESCK